MIEHRVQVVLLNYMRTLEEKGDPAAADFTRQQIHLHEHARAGDAGRKKKIKPDEKPMGLGGHMYVLAAL